VSFSNSPLELIPLNSRSTQHIAFFHDISTTSRGRFQTTPGVKFTLTIEVISLISLIILIILITLITLINPYSPYSPCNPYILIILLSLLIPLTLLTLLTLPTLPTLPTLLTLLTLLTLNPLGRQLLLVDQLQGHRARGERGAARGTCC
jgi:hypothetical protein